MTQEIFKMGDLITLITGSIQMIVVGYNRHGLVNCATWMEGHLINFIFPENTLQKVPYRASQSK